MAGSIEWPRRPRLAKNRMGPSCLWQAALNGREGHTVRKLAWIGFVFVVSTLGTGAMTAVGTSLALHSRVVLPALVVG